MLLTLTPVHTRQLLQLPQFDEGSRQQLQLAVLYFAAVCTRATRVRGSKCLMVSLAVLGSLLVAVSGHPLLAVVGNLFIAGLDSCSQGKAISDSSHASFVQRRPYSTFSRPVFR